MAEKRKADLCIQNVRVLNSYFKTFDRADVYIRDGRILYIDRTGGAQYEPTEAIDGENAYMAPGLIDIHMHIESSMLTPAAFCDRLARCGVTTIVSEPHEMANVGGINGIHAMIEAGRDAPVDVRYGIPSCVPSTSPALETTGGMIACAEMEALYREPSMACVGEVMNYRQIIHENDLEITKFLCRLREKDKVFPIEGHCPALMGEDLAEFLFLGINGDHTEHSVEELRARFAGGMFMEIQQKTLSPAVLDLIREHNLYEYFCFVTDDVMADKLVEEGHLDALVRRAIALGLPPAQAIYNATFTPARRMNLLDRGALDPGKRADFVLLSDLQQFAVQATYRGGKCIYRAGEPPRQSAAGRTFDRSYYHSIHLAPQAQALFAIRAPQETGSVRVRAIEVREGSTRTAERIVELAVKDGLIQWEGSGLLLAAVFERYGKNGGVGLGFLTGDCHKRGAVATSYAHDCHNLLAAGATARDLAAAVNRVIGLQGGMVCAEQGEITAELQLQVGGILSDRPAEEVGAGLARVRRAMEALGYRHNNPIMSFATVTLPVSPALKLTDKGLIDVKQAKVVPLFV